MSAQRCVGRPPGLCHSEGGMKTHVSMAGCRAVDGIVCSKELTRS